MSSTKTLNPCTHYSIFDIAGPIMVGPSSSHTAGACKIGQLARALFHGTPEKVTFILHGSFGTVYKGHATDRALLSGIMKFKTADPRIKIAFDVAKQQKLKYEFKVANLGEKYHPNTVKIILEKKGRKPMKIIGSSIGGGMVKIVKIDKFNVNLQGIAGHFKTLVVWHETRRKDLAELRHEIKFLGMRIHDIQTTRVGKDALSIINMEGRNLKLEDVMKLEEFDGMQEIRSLTKLKR